MMIVPDFTSSSRRADFISYPEWQETEYGNMMFLSDGEIRYCGIFETDNEYATNLHCWIGPEGQEVERAVAYVAIIWVKGLPDVTNPGTFTYNGLVQGPTFNNKKYFEYDGKICKDRKGGVKVTYVKIENGVEIEEYDECPKDAGTYKMKIAPRTKAHRWETYRDTGDYQKVFEYEFTIKKYTPVMFYKVTGKTTVQQEEITQYSTRDLCGIENETDTVTISWTKPSTATDDPVPFIIYNGQPAVQVTTETVATELLITGNVAIADLSYKTPNITSVQMTVKFKHIEQDQWSRVTIMLKDNPNYETRQCNVRYMCGKIILANPRWNSGSAIRSLAQQATEVSFTVEFNFDSNGYPTSVKSQTLESHLNNFDTATMKVTGTTRLTNRVKDEPYHEAAIEIKDTSHYAWRDVYDTTTLISSIPVKWTLTAYESSGWWSTYDQWRYLTYNTKSQKPSMWMDDAFCQVYNSSANNTEKLKNSVYSATDAGQYKCIIYSKWNGTIQGNINNLDGIKTQYENVTVPDSPGSSYRRICQMFEWEIKKADMLLFVEEDANNGTVRKPYTGSRQWLTIKGELIGSDIGIQTFSNGNVPSKFSSCITKKGSTSAVTNPGQKAEYKYYPTNNVELQWKCNGRYGGGDSGYLNGGDHTRFTLEIVTLEVSCEIRGGTDFSKRNGPTGSSSHASILIIDGKNTTKNTDLTVTRNGTTWKWSSNDFGRCEGNVKTPTGYAFSSNTNDTIRTANFKIVGNSGLCCVGIVSKWTDDRTTGMGSLSNLLDTDEYKYFYKRQNNKMGVTNVLFDMTRDLPGGPYSYHWHNDPQHTDGRIYNGVFALVEGGTTRSGGYSSSKFFKLDDPYVYYAGDIVHDPYIINNYSLSCTRSDAEKIIGRISDYDLHNPNCNSFWFQVCTLVKEAKDPYTYGGISFKAKELDTYNEVDLGVVVVADCGWLYDG